MQPTAIMLNNAGRLTQLRSSCVCVCLPQAKACSGATQAVCEKNAQCVYNPQAKMCARATVAKTGTDVFDDSVGALMVSRRAVGGARSSSALPAAGQPFQLFARALCCCHLLMSQQPNVPKRRQHCKPSRRHDICHTHHLIVRPCPRVQGACAKLTKKADCEAKAVTLQQAGKWKGWKQSATPATC